MGTPFRDHADQCHRQAIAMIDEPCVTRVCEREGLERAVPHDHRRARELDDCGPVAHRHASERAWRPADLGAQLGPGARRRLAAKHHRRSGEMGSGARRRIGPGGEHVVPIQNVRVGLAREAVDRHGGNAAQQEHGVCLVRSAQPVECGVARQLELDQRAGLDWREQRREGACDAIAGAGLAAIKSQLLRPASSEPLRLAGEEAVVRRCPRDAAVGQRDAMRAQVGAPVECGEHGLYLHHHCRVVGIRSHEAENLMQAHHATSAAEPRVREPL
jgi:hypothetical protein